MPRVDAKQLDALFEPPAAAADAAAMPGGEAIGDAITIDDFAKIDLRIARSSTPSTSKARTSCCG